jgi:two-component sensor histidine kinase
MFENFVDDGGQLCMRQTHEVCVPGIKPQIDNPQLGRLAYADGFERWANVLSQGDPIRGPVDALPPAERAILASQDILSILVLPIEIGHAWSGFIGFDETRLVREWSDEDVRLLQTAAEMIESYIERKQAQDARRRYVERLRILREIDAAILSAQSPRDIACVALERLYALIPYQYASIGEIDLEQQRRRDVVILGPEGVVEGSSSVWHPLAEGWEVVERTRRGEIYVVQDIAALERLSPMEQYLEQAGVRAYVSVPMMVREDLVGSLNLAVDRPGFFQPGYLEILGEMADSLSVAMQQASLLAQTQQDAEAKTMLLREVNHRVTNNLIMILSIIELEMDQQRTSEAGSDLGVVLQDIHDRIQGISAVHRMLSSAQQDALAPADVVSQVIEAAMSGSSIRQQVVVQVDAPGYVPSISSKQGVTLALIVNELTTNSIKYAFRDRSRGRIEVHMAMVEGDTQALRLTYRDDGPGMPREVLDGERQSVGLWLVRANVTHTLGGQVSWYNDGGAVFEIEFPLDTRA